MSKKNASFMNLFYEKIMPKVYGIGAAIVIVGALFKINHYTGADTMLIIGLSTEAAIFFLSAFEPSHAEIDWSKVYPELDPEYDGPHKARLSAGGGAPAKDSTSKQLDKMLESANIGPDLIKSLGDGMKNMASSASKMSNLSDAAVATSEYANNVKTASKSLLDMNKSYASTVTAMSEMSSASKDAKEYHGQVQTVTKNLSALNALYELELNDANSHLKSMNKFYSNVSNAMESMADASKETEKFKSEITSLTTNLTSLNGVYGSMLSAMRGNGNAPRG